VTGPPEGEILIPRLRDVVVAVDLAARRVVVRTSRHHRSGGVNRRTLAGMSEDYTVTTYGKRWATSTTDWTAGLGLVVDGETIASVGRHGRRRAALELAIGTGRVALRSPRWASRSTASTFRTDGGKLRAKPGGGDIPVTMGDFAEVPVEAATADLLVFNTIFALVTQEDQVRCFASVARHLSDDGVFVIEAFLPDLTRFNRAAVRDAEVGVDRAVLLAPGTTRDADVRRAADAHRQGQAHRDLPRHLRYCFPSSWT